MAGASEAVPPHKRAGGDDRTGERRGRRGRGSRLSSIRGALVEAILEAGGGSSSSSGADGSSEVAAGENSTPPEEEEDEEAEAAAIGGSGRRYRSRRDEVEDAVLSLNAGVCPRKLERIGDPPTHQTLVVPRSALSPRGGERGVG